MNEHDDVMSQVRESFSALHMDMPVEKVFATSRVRRRRRLAGLTATAAATAGAAAAITLVPGGPAALTHPGSPPPPRPDAVNQPPASLGSIKLAAFSVTGGPGDSTTLVLHKGSKYSRLDPAALREALARHGIPALVTVGTFCRPGRDGSANLGQVLRPSNLADGSAIVINGRAMPSGTRLSIGYFENSVRMLLVKDGTHLTCSSTSHQPAVHLTPSGPKIRG